MGIDLSPLPARPAARSMFALAGWLFLLAAGPARAEFRLPPHDARSVYDFAGVVHPDDAARMEHWHRALYDQTGVAIVVVTVPDLEGESIDDFATRVGTEWGVGKKGDDKGVVVALSLKPRRIHVATGYGVEGFLPDGKVGGILDSDVMPLLRQGDFSGGLRQASAALTSISASQFGLTIEGLAEARGSSRNDRKPGNLPFPILFLIIVVILIVVVRGRMLLPLILSGMGGRGGRGGWGAGGFGSGGFGGGGFGGGGFGGFGGGGFGGGGAGRGF